MAYFPTDDDHDAFEAAMSFVDEFVFSESESGASSWVSDESQDEPVSMSDGTVSVGQVRPIPQAPRTEDENERRRADVNERRRVLRKAGVYGDPNRVRKQRTREIASLRQQLEKLQIDFEALKRGEKLQSIAAPPVNAMVATESRDNVFCGIWKELADRQRRRREAAESDNVRLKLAVERQRKVANSLRSLMQKRTRQLAAECSSRAVQVRAEPRTVHVSNFHGDIGKFQGLFRQLDSAYCELDAVFETNGLARMEGTRDDVHLREGVGGKYLEFFTHKVLPFGFHDTAEATWSHFKGVQKHMGNANVYEKTAKDLDEPYTIVEDVKKELYANSSRADVEMNQVLRRYVEEDRDIVIRVSRSAPIEVKHKLLRGLRYHIRGYVLTKRSSASTPERELSVLQLCSLISLDHDPEANYDSETKRALTNFLIVHTAQHIRAHRELIENALIDGALRQRTY
ncbi:hypothetical protein PHYBOEH_007726 [Phytophthora boehmeriae]|uniref:M96 mating-specific protein family n=1 Tax=Phytophthora boehmeriae TaxID=109152 RepID=A0A8T1X1U9_9STRA|nr:hypothetical protein PHYBOEH_007726 [Phytophthora boehmeriae]